MARGIKAIYNKKKIRALERGIEFNLSFEDYCKLREITTCFYTGEKLYFHSQPQANSWSMDRIDNSIGYTMSNIVVCSHAANLEKGRSIDKARNKISDPLLYQKIVEKLRIQPQVITKSKSKWIRIWDIIWE